MASGRGRLVARLLLPIARAARDPSAPGRCEGPGLTGCRLGRDRVNDKPVLARIRAPGHPADLGPPLGAGGSAIISVQKYPQDKGRAIQRVALAGSASTSLIYQIN